MERKKLHHERTASKEITSSRVSGENRKTLAVGDDGSGCCGICSAHVTVRGVLDCCNHEYCFDCIENWSSVSNLCPLCKKQFRFISVETIYDEECDIVENVRPFPVKREREEELWDNEESGLRLSFPSFFIDEDAVACLDGKECLVRAGVPLQDEDAADTSVACDSCDRWYHAGCVGFDPSISWGSWLCPRCSAKASSLRPPPPVSLSSITTVGSSPVLPITTVGSSSRGERVPVAEPVYNATVFSEGDHTVSVSVVGEGESALLLSTCKAIESTVSSPEIREASTFSDLTGQASIVVKSEETTYSPLNYKDPGFQEPDPSDPIKVSTEQQKPVPSLPSSSKPDLLSADCDPVDTRERHEAICFLTVPISSAEAEQCDGAILPPPQVLQCAEPESDPRNEGTLESAVVENTVMPASYFDNFELEEQPRKEKRKLSTRQDRDIIRAEDLPEPPQKIARSGVKKTNAGKGPASGPPVQKIEAPSPKMDSRVNETLPPVEKRVEKEMPISDDVPLEDLVPLVKEEREVCPRVIKEEHTGASGSNSAGGVRTRVVMRRESGDQGAAAYVRRQLTAAAGCGLAEDNGKVNVTDERFFSAFKASMVCNQDQNPDRRSRASKRRRNAWLDGILDKAPRGKVGGVRESLTKKLCAGGVNGKTWERDWHVSFWKEQSARSKKPKREASDGVRKEEVIAVEEDVVLQKLLNAEDDSILNRLYVADTSLFPRSDDIKPLISLLGDAKDEGKPNCEPATSESKSSELQASKGRKPASKSLRADGTFGTVPVIPSPQGLKGPSGKTGKGTREGSGLPGNQKQVSASKAPRPLGPEDKRQWALELLARRSGDAVASSSVKCEGRTETESSFLGQVPEGLRPTIAPDRRSRIPTAVRQRQLNRILEHYLRKSELTNFQGGYKLKSLIASAVFKELRIHESSGSKGVYLTLCVRALSQQDESRLQVSIPEAGQANEAVAVTEALLATGLLSDSPPASPRENWRFNSGKPLRHQSLDSSQCLPVSSMLTGSIATAGNSPSNFSDGIDVLYYPGGDFTNVLDIIHPVSSDVVNEKDLDVDVKSCEGNVTSSARPESRTNSPPPVPANRDKNPEESCAGKEDAVPVVSPSSPEGKCLDVLAESTTKSSSGEKPNETSTLAEVGNSGAPNVHKVELQSTGSAAPVRSSGESDGDDWMHTGKFPDLDSRIDNVRKDVLKRNSSFASQFGEEHVFGGSFHKPTSTIQAPLGPAPKPSRASVPKSETRGSNPGGKESEVSKAVLKQVEAYVKEHLKPLHKSGIIKSDQFRYAVSKTASKVMQYHEDATSADFLIVQGSKVKKLAEEYLRGYVHKN